MIIGVPENRYTTTSFSKLLGYELSRNILKDCLRFIRITKVYLWQHKYTASLKLPLFTYAICRRIKKVSEKTKCQGRRANLKGLIETLLFSDANLLVVILVCHNTCFVPAKSI